LNFDIKTTQNFARTDCEAAEKMRKVANKKVISEKEPEHEKIAEKSSK
jgi:hypothetical protein